VPWGGNLLPVRQKVFEKRRVSNTLRHWLFLGLLVAGLRSQMREQLK